MDSVEALTPVYTAPLFPGICAELVSLLRRLDTDDWSRPTVAGSWLVRDVVAHMLDGDFRKLAGGRDGHRLTTRTASTFGEIVDLINELNASGVGYGKRLSPRLMTDLLEVTGAWVSRLVAELPPHAESWISVAWAGEDRSENWMDTGREYTERWHHQMQIREAVGAPGLLQRRWFYPLMDLSVRAFPKAYGSLPAPVGTSVVFEVQAEGDHTWSIVRERSAWAVMRGRAENASASVTTDADSAWKLLYNALPPETVRARVAVRGDHSLVAPLLHTRSVLV